MRPKEPGTERKLKKNKGDGQYCQAQLTTVVKEYIGRRNCDKDRKRNKGGGSSGENPEDPSRQAQVMEKGSRRDGVRRRKITRREGAGWEEGTAAQSVSGA